MKQYVNTEARFNEVEVALENMELHLLQAIWSLEKQIELQIESNKILNESIRRLLSSVSQAVNQELESGRAHSESNNKIVR
jgi:hypothetical protein